MDITEKLLKLKERITVAKESKARTEGKLEELMSRLKKDFNITSLDGANHKLDELNKKTDKLRKEMKQGMDDLEQEYGT